MIPESLKSPLHPIAEQEPPPVIYHFTERGTPYTCEKRRGFGGRMHADQRGSPPPGRALVRHHVTSILGSNECQQHNEDTFDSSRSLTLMIAPILNKNWCEALPAF